MRIVLLYTNDYSVNKYKILSEHRIIFLLESKDNSTVTMTLFVEEIRLTIFLHDICHLSLADDCYSNFEMMQHVCGKRLSIFSAGIIALLSVIDTFSEDPQFSSLSCWKSQRQIGLDKSSECIYSSMK